MRIRLLSGGAAQGIVRTLAERFRARTAVEIDATFSAVGAMRDQLLAGDAADLVILSRKLIDELAAGGHVEPASRADLGAVRTGVAVRAGDPLPDVSSAEALRASLLAAPGVYFPDPQRATAGIHFAGVLGQLGIADALTHRLRTFPNGTAAMQALSETTDAGSIGCTQITEIKRNPGVRLVGPLPAAFELATVYTAAVCTRGAAPEAARQFIALLTADEARTLRREAGFEP